MNDIKQKAQSLINTITKLKFNGNIKFTRSGYMAEALCLAIEQHEAFRQKVSDIVEAYVNATNVDDWVNLKSLIITEPDPLVEALDSLGLRKADEWAGDIRKALAACGLEIREKGQ